MFEKYINKEVWDCTLKYIRMMRVTKEKYFEGLLKGKSVKEFAKEIKKLWDMDHNFMDISIKELEEMIADKDFRDAMKFSEEPLTKQESIKLTEGKLYYEVQSKKIYPMNPEKDFVQMEQKYVNTHIKSYERQSEIIKKVEDKESFLSELVPKYDKLDKTIPYYNKNGTIRCYQTIATYNSMLYNWNLTHSAWNRTEYDAKILGNNLRYLVAHPFACPMCMEYQGFVYAEDTPTQQEMRILKKYGKPGQYMVENAVKGGVGHPNCKHTWTIFWDYDQIQEETWSSAKWEEEYKTEQKKQSLDLEKSRLLSDRRIYKELGDESKVDELTSQIKAIRNKKKEL